MSVTREDIESFHRFAEKKLEDGEDGLTMEEFLDLWRLENPAAQHVADDVLAVKAALRDLENGDRGVTFEEHIRETRTKFDIPADR